MSKMEYESASDFVLLTETFNEKFLACQSLQKEIVSEDEAVKALTYIEWLDISRIEDCFLFCAALNLCNTYVKQQGRKIDYSFKAKLPRLLKAVVNKRIDGILFDFQKDKRTSLLIVQIGKIQFSFHGVRSGEILEILDAHNELRSQIEWDGIRKQMCAVSVFDIAEKNVREAQSITGESIMARYEFVKNQVDANTIALNEIISKEPCRKKKARPNHRKTNSDYVSTIGEILKAKGIDLSKSVSE